MRYTTYWLRTALIVGLLLVWAGCDTFLEPDPASFSTTANFYENQAQFERAINGAYSQLRAFVGDDAYRNSTDLRGPTLTRHFDVNLPHTVAGIPQLDEWTMDVANAQVEGLWANMFELIKEANVVLGRIEAVEFEDAALKDRIMGEALFMRAFAYWVGVQTWGDLPLMLEEVSSPDAASPEAIGGRTSADAIYTQIIADLQGAVGRLPISYTGADVGRITRGAAKFLLGRTYLLTGNYAGALSEFEDLDGPDYNYDLLDTVRDVFDPGNKNNAESILELQYDPDIPGQPEIDNMFADVVPWNDENALSPGNVNARGVLMPTPDVIESFEAGDERLDVGIDWFVKEGNSAYVEIAHGDSLPYLNKLYWRDYVNTNGDYRMNFIVFRFADVLLSAAEAQWRLGNEGAAIGYLDRVRARSELGGVDLTNYSGEVTGSPLGDAVLQERKVELLGEGHYWLDLKRFGSNIALEVMEEHAERFRERDPKVGNQQYLIAEHKLLFPIPPRDIVLAGLQQNPDW